MITQGRLGGHPGRRSRSLRGCGPNHRGSPDRMCQRSARWTKTRSASGAIPSRPAGAPIAGGDVQHVGAVRAGAVSIGVSGVIARPRRRARGSSGPRRSAGRRWGPCHSRSEAGARSSDAPSGPILARKRVEPSAARRKLGWSKSHPQSMTPTTTPAPVAPTDGRRRSSSTIFRDGQSLSNRRACRLRAERPGCLEAQNVLIPAHSNDRPLEEPARRDVAEPGDEAYAGNTDRWSRQPDNRLDLVASVQVVAGQQLPLRAGSIERLIAAVTSRWISTIRLMFVPSMVATN